MNYLIRQFDAFYNNVARRQYNHTWAGFQSISLEKIIGFQEFFWYPRSTFTSGISVDFFDCRIRFLLANSFCA